MVDDITKGICIEKVSSGSTAHEKSLLHSSHESQESSYMKSSFWKLAILWNDFKAYRCHDM